LPKKINSFTEIIINKYESKPRTNLDNWELSTGQPNHDAPSIETSAALGLFSAFDRVPADLLYALTVYYFGFYLEALMRAASFMPPSYSYPLQALY